MEKRQHRKCDDKYFDALKEEESLSDEITMNYLSDDAKPELLLVEKVKHHIKLAQQDIEDALDKNVMGMVDRKQIPTHFEQNNEAKEIINKIFLKHFGAKLLEDGEY